jgi:hypothetical protein
MLMIPAAFEEPVNELRIAYEGFATWSLDLIYFALERSP